MSLQIAGTNVIDNTRQLVNITDVGTGTAKVIFDAASSKKVFNQGTTDLYLTDTTEYNRVGQSYGAPFKILYVSPELPGFRNNILIRANIRTTAGGTVDITIRRYRPTASNYAAYIDFPSALSTTSTTAVIDSQIIDIRPGDYYYFYIRNLVAGQTAYIKDWQVGSSQPIPSVLAIGDLLATSATYTDYPFGDDVLNY